MSKTIDSDLQTHYNQEATTITRCVKIVREDGEEIGITDLDTDIVYNGLTYLSAAGYTPTAIQNTGSFSVNNVDVEGILAVAGVQRVDIAAGLYDHAQIYIFELNYNDTTQGEVALMTGHWGECKLQDNRYTAEFRSLTQELQQTIGELYSKTCRANLGDTRCGVNRSHYTVAGTVTSVTSQSIFTDSARAEASAYFQYGLLTFVQNSVSVPSDEFFTPFTEYTVDTAPSGWTERWDTSHSWTVRSVGPTKAIRDEHSSFTNSYAGLTWDGKDADDVEILTRVRLDQTASGLLTGLILRGSNGTGSSINCYALMLTTAGITIYKFTNGTGSAIGSSGSLSISSGVDYWVRFRAIGTSLSGKIWSGEISDEPVSWMATATNGDITASGWTGVVSYNALALPSFLLFGVGTDGATAPGSSWEASSSLTADTNYGFSMEVKRFTSGGIFQLAQPMPYTIQVGDKYFVYAGCDKKQSTCISKFGNIVNFRGEPFVPGTDSIVKYPDAR
jgi:uncharacterized phage protein (TIGR02218 family)